MMNDRFKFRVYDKDCEQILYPEGEEEAVEFDGNGKLVGIDKKGLWSGGLNCIPMQCTSIKDKNGQFIYEGDILKIKDVKPYVVVRYKGIGFELYAEPTNIPGYHNDKYIPEDCEIVGNIYENADLIEGGENGNN